MINTVKIQGTGYLVNGNMSVPKAEGNRDYKEVQEAIVGGTENYPTAIVVEPEFTAEEVAEQARLEKVFEAKSYLASTDYKVLPDYDGDTTGIVEARAEARNTIRTKEVL